MFDSDAVISTNDPTLLRLHVPMLPIVCEQSSGGKVKITETLLRKSNANGFGNDVGSITNKVTAMYDVLASLEKGSVEYETLMDRILCGQAYQQESIDKIYGSNYMFEGCYIISEIPNSYCEPEYTGTFNYMFEYMTTLRKIPQALLDKMNSNVFYSNFIYNTFSRLYSIDEINGIFVNSGTLTSNRHNNMCNFCLRVKNITFRTNNGVPIVANWKNQIIDLTYNEGYAISESGTNSCIYGDITADKLVTDDATYQALKDDPDWWTADIAYSRYNHDSAVATINSLPDTSAYLATAGGTNTIKFKGESGSATDGGAINALTEEEIAVATAKGWTCSFV